MKKVFFRIIIVLLLIVSLGLNALLIYNLKNNVPTLEDCDCDNDINKEFTKLELGDLFKEYQSKEGLANSDNVVIWDVDKITYKGFFTSDGRKVYYIEETYSCVTGTDCVKASNTTTDDDYNTKATFVVAVNENNKEDLKFYVIDESLLKNSDFVKETDKEL